MLPQSCAAGRAFFHGKRLESNRRHCHPVPDTLLRIITVQTEIAKLGLDLGSVMAYVAEQVPQLTGASAAAVGIRRGRRHGVPRRVGHGRRDARPAVAALGQPVGPVRAAGALLHCIDSKPTRASTRRLPAGRPALDARDAAHPCRHDRRRAESDVAGSRRLFAGRRGHAAADGRPDRRRDVPCGAQRGERTVPARDTTRSPACPTARCYDRLRQSMHTTLRANGRLGILNIDMDGLKPINDGFGHRAGDAALREIATRMGGGAALGHGRAHRRRRIRGDPAEHRQSRRCACAKHAARAGSVNRSNSRGARCGSASASGSRCCPTTAPT